MKIHSKKVPFLPRVHNGAFHNFHEYKEPEVTESFLCTLKMYFGSFRHFMKRPAGIHKWIHKDSVLPSSQNLVATWLGHATVLLQVEGINIITDPLFGTPSFLYRRLLPCGIAKKDIPKIDVVLISHNHRDHFDAPSLAYLHERYNPLFLVPQGDKKWFLNAGYTNVEEFMWWDAYRYSDILTFTFVPAWHWSQRGLFDHNRSLWGGWVIETKQETIYFGGDTAYNKHYFTSIASYFNRIDYAFLPIGPGDPDAWMRRSHVNASQAGQAFLDCGARVLIPMHWGTFYFGHDEFESPIHRLTQWWMKHQDELKGCDLHLAKLGQQLFLAADKNS